MADLKATGTELSQQPVLPITRESWGASVETYSRRWLPVIEAALAQSIQCECSGEEGLQEPLRHLLRAGGKRFRPMLTLIACELVGGDPGDALEISCAIECFHTSSLILDDLPCMDNAPSRRGVPAVHVMYGEATAILASLALFNLGHKLAARAGSTSVRTQQDRHHFVAEALGPRGMMGGQLVDLHIAQRRRPSNAILEEQRLFKTSSLISAAIVAGAYTGGAAPHAVDALARFGHELGRAFQLRDDALDISEDGDDSPSHEADRSPSRLRVRIDHAISNLRGNFPVMSNARSALESIAHLAIERDR